MTSQSVSKPVTRTPWLQKAGDFWWAMAGLAIWILILAESPRFWLGGVVLPQFSLGGSAAAGIIAIIIQIILTGYLQKTYVDFDWSLMKRLRAFGIGSLIPIGLFSIAYLALNAMFSQGDKERAILGWLLTSAVIAIAAGLLAGKLPGLLWRGRPISRPQRWVLVALSSLAAIGVPLILVKVEKLSSQEIELVSSALIGLLVGTQTIAGYRPAPRKV